jgi:hypothetical protein
MELSASVFAFVKELRNFSYELSALDHVWSILFPEKAGKWDHLQINKYKHTFYFMHVNGDGGSLEVEPKKSVRAMDSTGASSYAIENLGQVETVWESLIAYARTWLKVVRKDWIKANKRIQVDYPLRYRQGNCTGDIDQPAEDRSVVIIAAMVNPTGHDFGAERVLLLNTLAAAVNLDGWALADKNKRRHPLDGITMELVR